MQNAFAHLGHLTIRTLTALILYGGFTLPLAAQEIRVSMSNQLGVYQPAVEALLRNAGFQPGVSLYPPERGLRMLESGETDIEAFRQPGAVETFRDKVQLIGPAACATLLAFVRVDPAWRTLPAQLPSHRIGVVLGTRVAESAAREFGPSFKRAATATQLFRMLDAGRIDVVLDIDSIGRTKLRELQLEQRIHPLPQPVRTMQAYLVLRTHHADWGPRIDSTLTHMLADGRWRKVMGDIEAARQFPRGMATDCLKPAPGNSAKPARKAAKPH
ncbi:MAG: transporter substrate-binding domain-containing protein [Rhodocyclaceae bacterium]